MRKVYIVILISLFVLSGCGEDFEKPTIENYGMVGIMGFDVGENGKLKVTVTLPQPEKDAEEKVQKFTVEAETPHQAIMEASVSSEKLLSTAQLRVVLFSEKFATEIGVWEVLQDLYRDPRVGTNSFIAVAKGSIEELLNGEYKDKPDINRYINKLLEPRTITAFSPFTTIHHFIRHITSKVSDPLAPLVEKDGDSIKLTEVALFKGDKMVGTIEREEAKIVESIKRNRKTSDIFYEIPEAGEQEKAAVVLNFIRSKRDISTNGDPTNPEIFIYLYISGSIVDYTGDMDLSIQKNRDKLEDNLSKEIEKSLLQTISKLQELGIDPMALGDYFKRKDRSTWSKEHWNDVFQRANITLHVEPRITSTGTIH